MKDTDLLKFAKIYYEYSLCEYCEMKGADGTPNTYCSYEYCADMLRRILNDDE